MCFLNVVKNIGTDTYLMLCFDMRHWSDIFSVCFRYKLQSRLLDHNWVTEFWLKIIDIL